MEESPPRQLADLLGDLIKALNDKEMPTGSSSLLFY